MAALECEVTCFVPYIPRQAARFLRTIYTLQRSSSWQSMATQAPKVSIEGHPTTSSPTFNASDCIDSIDAIIAISAYSVLVVRVIFRISAEATDQPRKVQ